MIRAALGRRLPDSRWGARAAAAAGIVLVVILVLAFARVLGASGYQTLAGGLAGVGIVYLAWNADPAWAISTGLAFSVFSPFWKEMGIPIGLDRVLILTGLLAVLLRAPASRNRPPLEWGLVPRLLSVAILWAAASSILAGTILTIRGYPNLLDRIGIIPLLVFLTAPMVFRTERQRQVLVGTMVALGAYLGITALFEILKLDGLVYPRYILDPSVGLAEHIDRARGPFAQSVGNGMALYSCAVVAAIAAATWKGRRSRIFAVAVLALCLAGTLFTLTRSIWLSAVVATLVTVLYSPELRRFTVPILVVGAVAAAGVLAFVPGLSGEAGQRSANERSIWDRYNINGAALNMIEERPLLGFGLGSFETESLPRYRQADTFPLTGIGRVAHNTFLSNLAELGLIGTTLWILPMLVLIRQSLRRRGPPELRLWQLAFLAITIQWFIVANFVLISYPFANLLPWVMGGVVAAGLGAQESVEEAVPASASPAPRPRPSTARPIPQEG